MLEKYQEFLNWCNEHQLLDKYQFLRKKHPQKKEAIQKLNELVPEELPISYKMKLIQKNISVDEARCPVKGCDNFRKFTRNKNLQLTCECRDRNHKDYIYSIKVQKTKENNLQKYGVSCTLEVEEFKEKRKKTFLKKYGSTTPLGNEKIKQKMFNTNLKKYGVKYPLQNYKIRKKAIKTTQRKYGVENYSQTEEYKILWQKNKKEYLNRARESSFLKYGVEFYSQTSKYKKQVIKTNLQKYGTEYYTQSKFFKNKYFNMENYNKLSKEYIEENFISEDRHFMVEAFCEFIECSPTTAYKLLHRFNVDWDYDNGGFDPGKPAILYYIKDLETNLYKIGITNNSLEERFGKAFCSKRTIALLEQTYENGEQAYLAEQEILQAFAPHRCVNESWPAEKGGKTEFFKWNVLGL